MVDSKKQIIAKLVEILTLQVCEFETMMNYNQCPTNVYQEVVTENGSEWDGIVSALSYERVSLAGLMLSGVNLRNKRLFEPM